MPKRRLLDLVPKEKRQLPSDDDLTKAFSLMIPLRGPEVVEEAADPMIKSIMEWGKSIDKRGDYLRALKDHQKAMDAAMEATRLERGAATSPATQANMGSARDMLTNKRGIEWMNKEFEINNPDFLKEVAAGMYKRGKGLVGF